MKMITWKIEIESLNSSITVRIFSGADPFINPPFIKPVDARWCNLIHPISIIFSFSLTEA